MTTAARQREAEQVGIAYQAALAYLGVQAVQEALSMWQDMPAIFRPAQASAWLARIVDMVLARRMAARLLAMAYYRLARALRTGRTIADPARSTLASVDLVVLRREFVALVGDDSGYRPGSDNDSIPVEKLPSLVNDHAALEADAEDEAEEVLLNLGPNNLLRKVREIDTARPADEVDARREQAHIEAGTRSAAAVERIVMNGARSATWSAAQRDTRVVGYARVSQSGTPCGFCAMLISRGAVYKTKLTATYSDGDQYHDNCHCVAIELYAESDYASERFALNREYQDLWPEVTKGHSGKDALRVWRRYFRDQQAASALAARSTPNALEATPIERQRFDAGTADRDRVRVR
ncbi:hypothetical protein ACIA8K_12680 [Catenuloplanes sp. NPDC051500]|uniref:VG15 protein n=1 Tax=Catenuloplanes sp. NPDC051500 TaxID=3363959 RepID=UPI0037906C5E